MPEIFRPRNKKLRHLGMHPQSVQKCECERGVLSQASGSISPLAQLPSPSIVAAQAYASEYQIPTGREGDAWSWRGSLTQVRDIPRRHSTVVTLAVGATSSGNPSSSRTAPSSQNVPDFRFTDEQLQKSKTHLNTAGPKEASAVKISDAKYHSETSASLAPKHRVPFQYTHDRLQTWGHAYFGNIATADAFVNAVSLRRPSLVATKEQDGHKSPRSSDQQIPILKQFETVHPQLRPQTNSNQAAVPIQYALHYLPVLAALMLSGHIRKGDSIDLPLPSPKVWIDTIAYVYTGQGEVTLAMKENIVFLAGRVESEG
ncbi:hypothetical protein sscle_05g042840 [Sclerotinia sclerotiorum 1980 UF-70]|uniref:Uncharacterized protein n=1 Tax=Sclerotinia sclerotiorum (strain ATCC 18683 / 1980 / Ss-1) TaxID=665079 RepID=A0A1D9Q3I2_SCLS1|nr:hypothetical protein sscle_05g042840 [Sclerotinia sclerotiorum 1980 UF-70]